MRRSQLVLVALVLSVVLAITVGVTPAFAEPVLTDSCAVSNATLGFYGGLAKYATGEGQTFTASVGGTLDSAVFYLRDHNIPEFSSAVGSIYAELWAISGTFGSGAVPTGVPLATSTTVDAATVPDYPDFGLVTFQFDNTVSLTQGTHYAIVCRYAPTVLKMEIDVGIADSEPHPGNEVHYVLDNVWTWKTNVADLIFYVYVNPTGTLTGTVMNALSSAPLSGVSVTLTEYYTELPTGQTVTGTDGKYTFTAVPPGVYTVAVSKAGYGSLSASGVTVTAGATTVQDFALTGVADDIATTIDLVDQAVSLGTLTGTGPGNSAAGKLGAFENMLAAAEASITAGDYAGALTQLYAVYARCDNMTPPPDFVTGSARDVVAGYVLTLISKLAELTP